MFLTTPILWFTNYTAFVHTTWILMRTIDKFINQLQFELINDPQKKINKVMTTQYHINVYVVPQTIQMFLFDTYFIN